jgi:transcriptional regulator GlxA family with amidase domain
LSAFERHYSVQQIAKLWNYSDDTIRRLFQNEAGVVRIGNGETRFKRKRWQLSIPESVLIRVHRKLSVKGE